MARKEYRESVVSLLYLMAMEGNYLETEYPKESIDTAKAVFSHVIEIDQIITDHLQNWTIDRLNYVDKAIIRFAVYEMRYTDQPYEIIINEAVNLTKTFTNLDDDQAKAFNNRLLDNIRLTLYP